MFIVSGMQDLLSRLPYLIIAFLPALTFHEWGHAFVATRLGDDTPRREGRLTLNPMAHLDPLGTIFIFLIGFGWAKPVPINGANLKGSWGEFMVASAGPGMNFILASFFAVLFHLQASLWFGVENAEIIHRILVISIGLNLALCFFNLLPIGPLDGSHLLARLLPRETSFRFVQWNMQYGSLLIFGLFIVDQLLHLGILSRIILIPVALTAHYLLQISI